MDKIKFLELAPQYYAIAIVRFLFTQSVITKEEIVDYYFTSSEQNPDEGKLLISYGKLLDKSLQLLESQQLINIETDPFGPPLIIPCADFPMKFENLCKSGNDTYGRYMKAGEKRSEWLHRALFNIAKEEIRLNIQDSDYDDKEDEWAPIPIDRDQPELKSVIEATNEAILALRSDNGYGANHPEERNYVLDGLIKFSTKIREATTVSIPYIRQYAIEPLRISLKAVGPSATGAALYILKDLLKIWLEKIGLPRLFD